MYFILRYYGVAHVAVLDDETVVNTRLEHLKHLQILHVIADVFQNIAVRDDAESTEDHPDGDVDLNVGKSCFHDISLLHSAQAVSL